MENNTNEHNLTGRELKEWVSVNDLLFKLSLTQAEIIISTIESASQFILIKDNTLCVGTISEDGRTSIFNTTIDDVVDLAAEINYEELSCVKKELEGSMSNLKYYCSNLKKLINLQHNSIVINSAFEQTVYAKNINDILQNTMTTDLSNEQPVEKKHRSL